MINYCQEEIEDPRKKRFEEEEKRRKRWNNLPLRIKRSSFLTAILIDKIRWCELGQFPVGMAEWTDACESALKVAAETTEYLRALEPMNNLAKKNAEELRRRATDLDVLADKEVQDRVYERIVDIEDKTKRLFLLLQRAKAETKER